MLPYYNIVLLRGYIRFSVMPNTPYQPQLYQSQYDKGAWLAMMPVVVGDWKRWDGRSGKGSPEGNPSGGGLGVSPRFRSPPRLGDIGVD
jgi:hypothetical protein